MPIDIDVIPPRLNSTESCDAAISFADDHTRVKLRETANVFHSDYINASYIVSKHSNREVVMTLKNGNEYIF